MTVYKEETGQWRIRAGMPPVPLLYLRFRGNWPKLKISKNERIPLAGLYGLLLLNCGFLLSLIRDYSYKEKESNFNFPIDVVARGKQIMMDI